jgi:galactokinase
MSGGRVHTARLRRRLFEAWGSSGDPVFVARAPGRVNLIGEHTDYNQGLVLPAAIGLEVSIALRPRTDRRVELHSLAFGETRAFDLEAVVKPPPPDRAGRSWIDYVAGVAWSLDEAGVALRGLQGVIDATLPVGAGLGSSAALALASAWALIDPDRGLAPSPHRIASLAHRAEVEFVGVRSGMMDQLASALGLKGHALLIDCRSMESEAIPIPPGIGLVVCDSGVSRHLAASAYNQRRAECEEGVRLLQRRLPGIASLRDVTLEEFERWKGDLPKTVANRCEHVIRENTRVRAVVSNLGSNDAEGIRSLFAESHASLRDLYEVSSPELDAMVEVASGVEGVVATRLTGAGFGGCTINLVRAEAVDGFCRTVADRYAKRSGRSLTAYAVDTAVGAGVFPT